MPPEVGRCITELLPIPVLSIGAGAVFEVVYEIAKLIRKDHKDAAVVLEIDSGRAGRGRPRRCRPGRWRCRPRRTKRRDLRWPVC